MTQEQEHPVLTIPRHEHTGLAITVTGEAITIRFLKLASLVEVHRQLNALVLDAFERGMTDTTNPMHADAISLVGHLSSGSLVEHGSELWGDRNLAQERLHVLSNQGYEVWFEEANPGYRVRYQRERDV